MRLPEDYQWPSATSLPANYAPLRVTARQRGAMEREIESFFESRWGNHAVVVPSARAAISLLLTAHGMGRAHVVFAPRWSSHCVWDAIGRHANPTISLLPTPDAYLAVHKWGQTSRFGTAPRGLVIEDSVDNLVIDRGSLFPSGGGCELFSLPKIIGTYCGGIALVHDEELAIRLREMRRGAPPALAARQTRLKHAFARSEGRRGVEWQGSEHLNTRLDPRGLDHVLRCLGHFDRNAQTIQRRLAQVDAVAPQLADSLDRRRLPSVLPVPLARYRRRSIKPALMTRNFDFARRFDEPRFEAAYLLPLHFAVSERQFLAALASLR